MHAHLKPHHHITIHTEPEPLGILGGVLFCAGVLAYLWVWTWALFWISNVMGWE